MADGWQEESLPGGVPAEVPASGDTLHASVLTLNLTAEGNLPTVQRYEPEDGPDSNARAPLHRLASNASTIGGVDDDVHLIHPAPPIAFTAREGYGGEAAALSDLESTLMTTTASEPAKPVARQGEHDDDDEEEEEEEEEEEDAEGDSIGPLPKPTSKVTLPSLLPHAKFSMPKEGKDPAVRQVRQSKDGGGRRLMFAPGLGGSDKSEVAEGGAEGADGEEMSPLIKPARPGVGWSASVKSQPSMGVVHGNWDEDDERRALSPELEASDLVLDVEQPAPPPQELYIRVLAVEGGTSREVVEQDITFLKSGLSPWHKNRSHITEVPTILQDYLIFPTSAGHARSRHHEYLMMRFPEPANVVVLLPSAASPLPLWITKLFVPSDIPAVHVEWHLGASSNLFSYLGMNYQRLKHQTLKVWKLKRGHLSAGDTLTLGGFEQTRLSLPIFNYLVCWKPIAVNEFGETLDRTKSIKYRSKEMLNAALEEAVVQQNVPKTTVLLKQGADVHVTLSTAAFRGSLLTKVPASSRNMPLLCCLVEHGAELDWYSLRYVMEYGHMLPVAHAPLQDFLTNYVRTRRNPANTCYAMALCLSIVAKEHTSKATEYSLMSEKFRMAAINLIEDLNKLSYIGGKERWMLRPDEVLEPTKHYSAHFPINLASCSSTALKMHDTDYSSTSTVQNFMQRAWMGVHYLQVGQPDPQESNVPLSGPVVTGSMFLYGLMYQYGFAGILGRNLITPASKLAHISMRNARPFFDSPRGRWCLKCLCHTLFLVVFHMALFEPKGWDRDSMMMGEGESADVAAGPLPGSIAWVPNPNNNARLSSVANMQVLMGLMMWWVLAIGVDLFFTCVYQFGGSLQRFLTVESVSYKIDLVQFVTLLGSIAFWGIVELATADVISVNKLLALRAVKVLFSISAIIVWVQTMYILRPLNRGLAPLLYVIVQMISEVFVFLLPLVALLLGFSAALFSIFWGSISDPLRWTSIWDVILLLFRFFVSDFQMSFDIFTPAKYDEPFEVDPVLRLYAIFIILVYVVLASILMANLLIAVLTYKYDPEQIDAESNFQTVMTLQDYQVQVDNKLLPAPFSPLIAAKNVLCLPSGWRPKLEPKYFRYFGLPPLDDTCNIAKRPIGAKELHYLIYLVTLVPVINVLTAICTVLLTPYCVLHFTLSNTHSAAKRATREILQLSGSQAVGAGPQRAATGLRTSFFTRVSRRSTMNTRGQAGASRGFRKTLNLLFYVALSLAFWPFAALLACALYSMWVVAFNMYTVIYTWLAAVAYSVFWTLFGFGNALFQLFGFGSAKVSPEGGDLATPTKSAASGTSRKSAAGGKTRNKQWGKLLAKQRKEEFKKIAFRPEEVDTALVCAGIAVPVKSKEEDAKNASTGGKLGRSITGGTNRTTPRASRTSDTGEGVRLGASAERQRSAFNASLADGKAKMMDAQKVGMNSSSKFSVHSAHPRGPPKMNASIVPAAPAAGPRFLASKSIAPAKYAPAPAESSLMNSSMVKRPAGLANGYARFDSRYPDRGGLGKAAGPKGALGRALTRKTSALGAFGGGGLARMASVAPGGGGPRHGHGALQEVGGLMNEMGGVRDDLTEIRTAIQELSLEVIKMKRFIMEGEDEDEEDYDENEDGDGDEEDDDSDYSVATSRTVGGFTDIIGDEEQQEEEEDDEGDDGEESGRSAVETDLLEKLEARLDLVSGGKSRLEMPGRDNSEFERPQALNV